MQVKPIANFPGVFINPKHVEHYKQYIINNGLITRDEIPGTDPTIQKVSFESDDPMTFSDILDKFPANCIPVKVDLYTSNNYQVNYMDGWDERTCILSGIIENDFFIHPTVGYNSLLNLCAEVIPKYATAAHEGHRTIHDITCSSQVIIEWDSNDHITAFINDGEIKFDAGTNPSGTDPEAQVSVYYNQDANRKTATTTQEYTITQTAGANRQFNVDYEPSTKVDISNYDINSIVFGSFIGDNNTTSGTVTFVENTVLQYITGDIYYVLTD